MSKLKSLGSIKNAAYNPRKIGNKSLGNLTQSLRELGDLGIITIDWETGDVISGNQRDKVIDIQPDKIQWLKIYDTPQSSGTIAIGIVEFDGEPFAVRAVQWESEELKKIAMLRANATFGTWDLDKLAEEFDEDLLVTSFLDPAKFFPGLNDDDREANEATPEDELPTAGVSPLIILRFKDAEDMEGLEDELRVFLQARKLDKRVNLEVHKPKSFQMMDVDDLLGQQTTDYSSL